eukprot:gene10285-11800_t
MSDKQKKPSVSKFKQQTLPAWRPILTPKAVLPMFVVIGLIFIGVGSWLIVENNSVQEVEIDYTTCEQIATGAPAEDAGASCGSLLSNKSDGYINHEEPDVRCQCEKSFQISGFSGEAAYLYYALDGYYQNHRRYVDSRSDPQLRMKDEGQATEECDPIENNDTRYYAPCGLIANSLFNDTLELYRCDDPAKTAANCGADEWSQVELDGSDITWKSDREVKFNNFNLNLPNFSDAGDYWKDVAKEDLCNMPQFSEDRSLKPPNWPMKVCELGKTYRNGSAAADPKVSLQSPECETFYKSSGNGYAHEDLIVWMRTAALPSFRKLYRKAGNALSDGAYKIKIGYNYPVIAFGGKKKFVLSTTSSIGGKNGFLGGAYLAVGVLSLVSAAVFFAFMMCGKGRADPDLNNMKWD